MGYTHYYYQTRDFTDTEWNVMRTAFDILVDQTDIPLANWEGENQPECDDKGMSFNGVAPEEDHESFVIDRKMGDQPGHRKDEEDIFHFCKTAEKPYDEAVIGMLLVACWIAPAVFRIGSDGCMDGEEWHAGRILSQKVISEINIMEFNYGG